LEQTGRQLFYGKAACFLCHNSTPGNPNASNELNQLYTDNQYHHLGLPFNRMVPVSKGEVTGLTSLVNTGFEDNTPASENHGHFRTPTLRNVAQGTGKNFIKAYMHNGYFKSLERVVQFYNTRDTLKKCEEVGIEFATDEEAKKNNCWPEPEFDNASKAVGIVGNLGLTPDEETALVAYLKTLSDQHIPQKPR
jgi:cytochrome c peroxidase